MSCETQYRLECTDVAQEEVVLIGGAFDREVIFIDKSTTSYVRLQIVSPRDDISGSETYVLRTMKGSDNFFRIGVHQDMDMDDVMERLIEYYKEDNSSQTRVLDDE